MSAERNGKREDRAFSQFALTFDSAFVDYGDMTDNGESKPCTSRFSAPCFVDPVETFEDT